MQKQRVLVVPTRTTEVDGLPALPDMQIEVHAISASSVATVLPEPVEWLDIMRALLDGEEYNIVHFCGHLTDQGLILASEVISIDGLVMMFRGSPEHRKLIVFNTCNSVDAARRVAANTPCAVIGTIGEVEDRTSAAFAVKFYSALRNEAIESYRDAFNASVGDKKRFIYLEGATKPTEDEEHIKRGDSATLAALVADMREVKDILTGGMRGDGIVQEQRELRRISDGLMRKVDEHAEDLRVLNEIKQFTPMLRTMQENSKTDGRTGSVNYIIGIAFIVFVLVWTVSVLARGGF